MTAKSFLYSFNELITSLEADESIDLLFSSIQSPASEDSLQEFMERYGKKLPELFYDLYKTANGFQCVWKFKNSKSGTKNRVPVKRFRALEPIYSEWYYDGCINILPIEEIFNSENWKNQIWFENDKERQTNFIDGPMNLLLIKQNIFPFDLFSTTNCIAFYLSQSTNGVPFFLTQDYYVDFDTSYITDIGNYLSFLISTKGNVEGKKKAFNKQNGFMSPAKNADDLLKLTL